MKIEEYESSAVQASSVESGLSGTYQSRLRPSKKMLTDLKLRKLRYNPEISAERMKGKKTHVPLASQAVTIFRRLKELAGGSEWAGAHAYCVLSV